MRKLSVAVVCLAFCMLCLSRSADALPDFKKVFDEKYTKDSKDEPFKAAVKKQGCNVCHVKGKKKEEHNAYGKALADLVEGDAQERIDKAGDTAAKAKERAKLVEEFKKAIAEVEKAKVDPEKEDAETYGDRLQANKLPIEPSADDAAGDDEEESEEN